MELSEAKFTKVTFHDGSVAYFTSEATAKHVCNIVETAAKFVDSFGLMNAAKKPANNSKVEEIRDRPHSKLKVEKPTKKPVKKDSDSKYKNRDYGTRKCEICGNEFSPRSGRAKVCDTCRDSGALRKREKGSRASSSQVGGGKSKPVSAALQEVRKAAADAHLI